MTTPQERDAARAQEEQQRHHEEVDLVTPDGEGFNEGIGGFLNCLLD